MAGPTNNPYRFGGQVGYRRDGQNRLYIRERHLDTSRGQWLSRDPVPVADTGFNFYWYVKNKPTYFVDPLGLRTIPTPSRPAPSRPGIPHPYPPYMPVPPIVGCPKTVANAKSSLCAALQAAGQSGITGAKCAIGPKQAQCLLDWCNQGNVYCVPQTAPVCSGNCAYSYGSHGQQNPAWSVYMCVPIVFSQSSCGGKCSSAIIENILHEAFGNCGTQHTSQPPLKPPLDPDPCENKADCLCSALHI